MSPDDETAVSLCRRKYGGDRCVCERAGRVVCAPMAQAVAQNRDYLDRMRDAIRPKKEDIE